MPITYWKSYNLYNYKKEEVNTSNMNVNHLITPCKPPACSNSTIHPNTIINILSTKF